MSWLDDNKELIMQDRIYESNQVSKILNKLDNTILDKFNNYLKYNYIKSVCNIMDYYDRKEKLTDKQKYNIAKYIYENNLQFELKIGDD